MRVWNKAPAIWFPSRLGTFFGTVDCRCGESNFGAFRSVLAVVSSPLRVV
jgi:hypothetical protein